MSGLNYLDYTAYSPKDELRLALQHTYSANLNGFCSLKGRAVCLLRVLTHASSIILKPLYYLAIVTITKLAICIFRKTPNVKHQNEKDADSFLALTNPEITRRFKIGSMALCSLVAPLSQLIQVCKAVAGIIHPGLYFKNDTLAPYTKELSATAKEVNCSPQLIKCLERGSLIIHKSLRKSPNNTYYYAQIQKDLAFICEKFRDPQFPPERKLALLTMLNPDPKGSGIEACPPVLARILQQISVNINTPAEPEKVIPWLEDQFKNELLNQMVIQASASFNKPNNPEWHGIVRQLAHDPAHRGNALALTIGDQIGLSQELMDRVKQDPMAMRTAAFPQKKIQVLLDAFAAFNTEGARIQCIKTKINSQPDGSPGLRPFRNHMLQILAAKIEKEEPQIEDSATEAVRRYYINGGVGAPQDEGHTDLNEQAIRTFCNL